VSSSVRGVQACAPKGAMCCDMRDALECLQLIECKLIDARRTAQISHRCAAYLAHLNCRLRQVPVSSSACMTLN
jgi:hypothetical protein